MSSFDTFAAPNPDFKIGEKAPLSIKPSNTSGFSPGMALFGDRNLNPETIFSKLGD